MLQLLLLLIDPPDFPAILPFTSLNLIIFAREYAESVLFALAPVAIVPPSVFPDKGTFALSLIIKELPFVSFAVSPYQKSVTMHLVFFPLAVVHFSIGPNIFSLAENFVVLELT